MKAFYIIDDHDDGQIGGGNGSRIGWMDGRTVGCTERLDRRCYKERWVVNNGVFRAIRKACS